MSNELERMFAALADDADRIPLQPARAVRRRSDRRRAAHAVLACAAVAALVTGTAVGTGVLLADRQGAPGVPADTVAPSPTGTASPSPADPVSPSPPPPTSGPTPSGAASTAPTGTGPTGGAVPSSIPAAALLGDDDYAGTFYESGAARRDLLPPLCEVGFDSESLVGVRRTKRMLFVAPGSPEGTVPEGQVDHTVTVYRADGAEQFLAELPAVVAACPSESAGSGTYRHRLIDAPRLGDESVLVESLYEPGPGGQEPMGERPSQYLSAVRVGDAVSLLWISGWEHFAVDLEVARNLAGKGADRLTAWRG